MSEVIEKSDESEGLTEEEIRSAWKAELLKRIEEIRDGEIAPEPIEEMFRRSREKYPQRSMRGE